MDGSIQESRLNKTAEPKSKYLKREIYEESKKIWKVALPGSISRVSSFGVLIVTRSFMGHISSADLAGYALVQSLSVRFANGIVLELSRQCSKSWLDGDSCALARGATLCAKSTIGTSKLSQGVGGGGKTHNFIFATEVVTKASGFCKACNLQVDL
ncbi:hypothetical protein BUALT_Bualt12G0047700 [Buddleja alternifolia]|uniref:Uncharacterized protein n=1 Tax=Buddleja alternifolia TaxID=168488 RepID=A0AAV6WPY7_9LAMI|nr:hypothetical protein BUALT_Bualt12G0047700 [Buddleja alternifolia]